MPRRKKKKKRFIIIILFLILILFILFFLFIPIFPTPTGRVSLFSTIFPTKERFGNGNGDGTGDGGVTTIEFTTTIYVYPTTTPAYIATTTPVYPDIPTDDCNLICNYYGYTGIDDLIGLPDYPHCMPAYEFITDSYGEMCCCKIDYDCTNCTEICNIYEYGFGGYGPVIDVSECGDDPLSIISFNDLECDVMCCCYLEEIDLCDNECVLEDYLGGRSTTWAEGGCDFGAGEAVLVTGEDYHLCCCETGITNCNDDCIALGYSSSVLRGYCLESEFMLGRMSSDTYCCCVNE